MTQLFDFLKSFNYKIHRVNFKVIAPVKFPFFHGTALRGIIGDSFLKIIESAEPKKKERFKHVLEQLYNPPLPDFAKHLTRFTKPPTPFIVSPNLDLKLIYFPGDFIEFNIVLIGEASAYIAELLEAFQHIENLEVGGSLKGKMRLHEIREISGEKTAYNFYETKENEEQAYQKLFINFLSPVYLQNKQDYFQLTFQKFITPFYTRLTLQTYLYCDKTIKANDLINQFEEAVAEEQFETLSVKMVKQYARHWSNDKKDSLNIKSKIGSMVFKGNFTNYVPFLELGLVSHIGTMASSGLGKFKYQVK